jgi:hypothetical protein
MYFIKIFHLNRFKASLWRVVLEYLGIAENVCVAKKFAQTECNKNEKHKKKETENRSAVRSSTCATFAKKQNI